MTSTAFIAHVLSPLIDPQFAEQDAFYEMAFGSGDDQLSRDYLRNFKRSATYSLDWAGDKLLTATKDGFLRLYDPERGEGEERAWAGEWMSMQCDPNSPFTAAAVSWSGKFRVFDTRMASSAVFDVDLKKTSPTMKDFLWLCWSPDSKHIAVSNRSDQIYLLDLRELGKIRLGASKAVQHEVNQMVWAPDGDTLWIATSGTPGKIHLFSTPAMQADDAPLQAHQYATLSLAGDPQGKHIASGGSDCLVTLWDPEHLVCMNTFGFATQPVTTLGFNHNGSLLAWGTGGTGSTGGEKNLTIVGANTAMLYWQDSTPAPVQTIRWHPKRNVLAYSLNVAQLPDERDRRASSRELAVVHIMRIPDFP